MRIGVHLQALRPGEIGGMESYARNLLDAAIRIAPEIRWTLFCAEYNHDTFPVHERVERLLLSPHEFRRLSAGELVRRRIDLWFCPLLVLQPDDPGLPSVATLPDVQHERFPELFSPEILEWRWRHYPATVATANRILTLSEFSRREIVDLLGARPERVQAIPLDGGSEIRRVEDAETLARVRARYELPARFLYYPAKGWPHKNHASLFEALGRLAARGDQVPDLVLTGSGIDLRAWDAALKESGVSDRVRAIGFVPEEDLAAIYSLSSGLIFPSRYEGFGIPVVEAMRCACPVLCSQAGSLPEVGGDAPLYFDPDSPNAIADAVNRLLTEPELATRLAEKGVRRAKAFSWERTAEATLTAFREVLNDDRQPVRIEAGEALPRITIVTPSFQQGPFIERTLRSVLDQGYPDLEYWVVDGGSSDETTQILERYRREHPGVFHYVSEADAGQADAVNKGFERATGEVIGWLNSDDTYEPGSLARVARIFRDTPEREMIYGRGYYVGADDRRIGAYPVRDPFDWVSLASECYLCQPCVFLRRSIVDRGVRLDARLQMCMDYDLWIRLGKETEPLFVDDYLANSRMYDDNKTVSQRDRVYDEVFATVKRHYGYLPLSWAIGRAHYRCDGNHPLDDGTVSFKALSLAAWYLLRYNPLRPTYLASTSIYGMRRVAGRIRGELRKGTS